MILTTAQWYTKKWVSVSLHTVFWILFFVSPYLIKTSFEHDSTYKPEEHIAQFILALFLTNFIRPVLFYLNALVFIRKFIYKRRFSQYFAVLLIAYVVVIAWDNFIFYLLVPGLHFRILSYVLLELPTFIFVVLGSTAYRVIADKIREEQRAKEKETENLKTELSFLRSQVSPHFMFNVLNNMVALARKKSDLLEPSLIKLSSLLRYMLYETDEDKVLLEKEIEYLKSYIELQSQRFGRNVDIHATFDPVTDGFVIEPMLLIPFVENAFKHGTGLVSKAQIDIHLKMETATLDFRVRNRYSETGDWEKDKTSGIGLTNVKRRLNLLYPNSHSLQISKEDGWFSVLLQLNLH
jgi:two-component system LytT family sensor kinase